MKRAGDAMDKLLRFLHIRPITGGLEITDQLIRLAYSDGATWQFRAVRMELGVCEEGKIKDAEAFQAALSALRAQIPELSSKNRTMNVVISLGAAPIYNQIFSLPLIKGEGFETAVKLNLQMSSPMDVAETYSGWEVISRDEAVGRAEVLGAFADHVTVDAVTNALFPAGFVAVAVESKALAIARVVRECGPGFDPQKSYLIAIIDDSGLDFIILRRGWLCFEYMNPWRDIADEKGAITIGKFSQAFALGLRQVANFYRQHWQDPIAGIGLSGDFLMEEARNVIGKTEPMSIFLLEDALGGVVCAPHTPQLSVTLLWPALRKLLPKYPDVKVEVAIQNGFTDIVAERFDAGVRLGATIAKDMIAMPIGPEMRMVTVAAPAYLAGKTLPKQPQDLTDHSCINLRLSTLGGLYAWEFEKRGKEFRVHVEGQFIVNGIAPMLTATLDGCGIGYLPLDLVQPYLDKGKLVLLLADWTPPFAGYHLYYPSRRQPTAAFTVLLETLRYTRQSRA